MRLILTHEQADFDALASMLGAYLLDDSALAVVPRRMNRNVRAFITLYGAELPFIDPRDLPASSVESVWLVDTQTMATIRGVSSETRVYVLDHHTLRANSPSNWTVSVDEVGATSTLLVEQLRESINRLTMVQATLLLLGIYEDTGSLTYSRTTSRDLNAAAYLLEQGANLTIAGDFLNHPLSLNQQEVYDQLRDTVESLDFHGHRVLIACGDAQEMDEELSTVAHKLRDLLDPDAIFVLVNTRSGVQLICRSTTDHIDVAEIATYFGGGGHSRASASLIRGKSREEIKAELLAILPEYVHPAITVAEIMSRGPQVLPPSTLVQEAADRMQRYGYEGYPVIQDGKVIGLLTRRAVDRAISHKLNLTASSLMEAGNVTVHPEDSVEHLQRIMTDTGWGQVPVSRKEDGEIIGIVTRTDLLKTLTGKISRPTRMSLSERLESALPPVRLAFLKAVSELASAHHTALYLVGGFVRDLLMDRPSIDFDLVVEGDAITLAHALGRRFGGRITTHTRFGTAKWLIEPISADLANELGFIDGQADLPEFLDLISARTEFYTHPTALPTVERGNIKLDLHRRDFTINTLAMRLDGSHYGELYDYWGGLPDLREKLVRVLHSLSFVDDPTRMLRAVRFEQRFHFSIENRTVELLHEALTLFSRVSGERIRHELDHILNEENRLLMLNRLAELGLLQAIHPGMAWTDSTKNRMQKLSHVNPEEIQTILSTKYQPAIENRLAYILWFIDLPEEQAAAVLWRMKYPPSMIAEIRAACKLYRVSVSLKEKPASEVVRMLEKFPPLAIYGNYLSTEDEPQRSIIWRYLVEWRNIEPTIHGDEIHARGLPPGPIYGRILDTLRSAWLDGEISSRDDERLLFEKLLKEYRESFS